MHILPKYLSAMLAVVAVVCLPTSASAASRDSDRLRAAIIYNIVRFVDFDFGGAGRTLDLCTTQNARGLRSLAALNGRHAGGRTIKVRAVPSGSRGGNCDVVYLGVATKAGISRFKRPGVLLIGDSPSFVRQGGMVGLVTTGKQIRFEVNTKMARQADIRISSKLLRLASRVHQ